MNKRINISLAGALAVAALAACESNTPVPATTPDAVNDLGTLSDSTDNGASDATVAETLPDAPKAETANDAVVEAGSDAVADTAADVQPELPPPVDVAPDQTTDVPAIDATATDTTSVADCGGLKQLWFEACGTPVCGPWQKKDGVPDCTTQKPGEPCTCDAPSCDPHGDCNQLYVCSVGDPKAMGCPKSQRAVKSEIRYLSPADTERVKQQLLATKLATYRYTESGPQGPRHLGFIIDDQPQSPAVAANGERVDLYGYLSMAVATLQVQSQQIERLEQEVARLQKACSKR